jgi:hypothetical protein
MAARTALAALIFLALATVPLVGQDKQAGKHSAFEQFKLLAGDWVAKGQAKDGSDIHVRYKVTAGGSAVVETIFPGTEHEMISVIHPDGPELLLTHYCMLGNQPQMKASGTGEGNKVEFKFVRATNLKSENDRHMHDATFTFVDRDTLRAEWTSYKDGKAAAPMAFELKRQK